MPYYYITNLCFEQQQANKNMKKQKKGILQPNCQNTLLRV